MSFAPTATRRGVTTTTLTGQCVVSFLRAVLTCL